MTGFLRDKNDAPQTLCGVNFAGQFLDADYNPAAGPPANYSERVTSFCQVPIAHLS